MRILAERQPDVHLSLHGAYVEYFAETYGRKFLELVDEMRGNVTYAGAYDHSDLPRLMHDIDWVVVPSKWWENSPLVVQEAFMHCRPVICSGIGGLAEKVQNEVNGLHFTVGDPGSSPRSSNGRSRSPASGSVCEQAYRTSTRSTSMFPASRSLYRETARAKGRALARAALRP